MKIHINATPEEIAALVAALQGTEQWDDSQTDEVVPRSMLPWLRVPDNPPRVPDNPPTA